jgi:hypothetical protein
MEKRKVQRGSMTCQVGFIHITYEEGCEGVVVQEEC